MKKIICCGPGAFDFLLCSLDRIPIIFSFSEGLGQGKTGRSANCPRSSYYHGFNSFTGIVARFCFIDLELKGQQVLLDHENGRIFHPDCPIMLAINFHVLLKWILFLKVVEQESLYFLYQKLFIVLIFLLLYVLFHTNYISMESKDQFVLFFY